MPSRELTSTPSPFPCTDFTSRQRTAVIWLAMFGMILICPVRGTAQDCNNNGIPDANEMQGVHASLDFDAVDDYVRIPRSASMEPTHEMTFEAWVRPDSAGPYRSNICRNSADFGAGYILAWQWNGAGKLELRIDQATNGAMTLQDPTPTSTYTGQWTHVAFTYSVSANSVKLFVNGVQKASAAAVGPLRYSSRKTRDLHWGWNLPLFVQCPRQNANRRPIPVAGHTIGATWRLKSERPSLQRSTFGLHQYDRRNRCRCPAECFQCKGRNSNIAAGRRPRRWPSARH